MEIEIPLLVLASFIARNPWELGFVDIGSQIEDVLKSEPAKAKPKFRRRRTRKEMPNQCQSPGCAAGGTLVLP
jgi:hypothetical protein